MLLRRKGSSEREKKQKKRKLDEKRQALLQAVNFYRCQHNVPLIKYRKGLEEVA